MSSCTSFGAMRPGCRLVVERAGFEASVQDADEPVAQLPQGGEVADVAGSERVVVGAGTRRGLQRGEGLNAERVDEPVVVDVAGQDGPFLPGSAGDRAGSGVVLAGFGVGVAAWRVAELGEHPGTEDPSQS